MSATLAEDLAAEETVEADEATGIGGLANLADFISTNDWYVHLTFENGSIVSGVETLAESASSVNYQEVEAGYLYTTHVVFKGFANAWGNLQHAIENGAVEFTVWLMDENLKPFAYHSFTCKEVELKPEDTVISQKKEPMLVKIRWNVTEYAMMVEFQQVEAEPPESVEEITEDE